MKRASSPRRSRETRVRLTEDERVMLEGIAKRSGETISVTIRRLIRAEAHRGSAS